MPREIYQSVTGLEETIKTKTFISKQGNFRSLGVCYNFKIAQQPWKYCQRNVSDHKKHRQHTTETTNGISSDKQITLYLTLNQGSTIRGTSRRQYDSCSWVLDERIRSRETHS